MAGTTKASDTLRLLAQVDTDAVLAYDQAIKRIKVEAIALKLESFQADHERHIETLGSLIRKHGGEPPAFSRDLKGFVLEGMTAAMSALGTHEALLAMRQNEGLTNRRYADALTADLPEDDRLVLRKHADDERRHLDYINLVLRDRLWDEGVRNAETPSPAAVPPLSDLGAATT